MTDQQKDGSLTVFVDERDFRIALPSDDVTGETPFVGERTYWTAAEKGSMLDGSEPVGFGETKAEALRDFADEMEPGGSND